MEICPQHEWNISAWQAASVVFLRRFKDKILLAEMKCVDVHTPKEWTTEAFSMIVVITIFLIFAVLGSLSTAFELIYEKYRDKKGLRNSTNKKDFPDNLGLNGIKSISIFKGWLINSRSFLQCFCFLKNTKKIFQIDSDKELFKCFHGIRFFGNFFIIFCHVCLANLFTIRSLDKLNPLLKYGISTLVLDTVFTVDAFFVLSGFLNAYSFSKEYNKNNGKISWWNFYLKRFVRLTPVYMMVLGIYTTLLSYTGSGPIWPEYLTNPVCKDNWWRHLIYINNFQSCVKSCMVWCWHLAAEMQVFVVSPIFLLSLLRWPRFGYGLSSVTIILSCLSSFIITKRYNLIDGVTYLRHYLHDFETFVDRFWTYMDKVYVMPYTRMSSYLIGLLLGYYLHDKNFKETRNSLGTLCCGWIMAAILIGISFFALLNREESLWETALYNSVKHLFFSVGLSWIIFVCLTGQGGYINSFLSWKLYFPFANLSYCAYVFHILVLQRDYLAANDLEEFSFSSLGLRIIHVYFWTIVISIPLSLLFELPMINMFYLYTKKRRHLKKEEKREETKSILENDKFES